MNGNNNDKISQANIKKDNIRSIFYSISKSKSISRAEISRQTGLSLMTVGKVADALTRAGMVTQVKPATGNAGRRAGMLAVSESNFILTFDISSPKFKISVLDLSLNRLDGMTYTYNDSLFPEDNLVVFFREANALLLKYLMNKKLVGVGICVSGEYDAVSDTVRSPKFAKLDGVKISESMKKAMGFSPDRIMDGVEAAAISSLELLPIGKRGCTVNIVLDGGVSGCIVYDGNILPRKADFENIVCANGRTLGKNLMESNSEEEIAAHLAYALKPVLLVISPDSVFISSVERRFSEWFEDMICRELGSKEKNQTVIFENGNGARSDMGIASCLIEDMFLDFKQ